MNMSIRKKLRLNCLLLVVVGLLSAAMIISISEKIEHEEKEILAAEEILRGIFDMNASLSEFLLTHAERPFRRWEMNHAAIGELLGRNTFDDGDEIKLMSSMREEHSAIGAAMASLRSLGFPESGRFRKIDD